MDSRERKWIGMNTQAVPVKVRFSTAQELDPLEQAVCRLCGIRARQADDMATLLGLPTDLVDAAAARLAERGALNWTQAGFTLTTQGSPLESEGQAQQGWAVLDPRSRLPIPRLWMGPKPPPAVAKPDNHLWIGSLTSISFDPPKVSVDEQRIQEALSRLCLEPTIYCVYQVGQNGWMAIDWESEGTESQRWNVTKGKPKSILLGRVGEPHAKIQIRPARCRLAVDFFPQIVGSATFALHEPDLEIDVQGLPDTAISPHWLEALPDDCRSVLDSHAHSLGVRRSIVLSRAGIRDQEDLHAMVLKHFHDSALKHGHPGGDLTSDEGRIQSRIQQAQEWLILAQREDLGSQARDSYGHVIEVLCQELAKPAMALLSGFIKDRRGEGGPGHISWERLKDPTYRRERLGALGLSSSLGPSQKHLEQECSRPGDLLAALNRGGHGAGDSLLIWLLPLLVLEDEQAQAYSQPIVLAMQRNPILFQDLATLVEIRNVVFHERDGRNLPVWLGQPEGIDNLIMKVWSAILAGRRRD